MTGQDHAEAELVAALHRAALDPASWRDFLLRLENRLLGVKTSVGGIDHGAGLVMTTVVGGFDADFEQSYHQHFHTMNPFSPHVLRSPAKGPQPSTVNTPDEALWRTEFYQDWMRHQEDLASGVGLHSGTHGQRRLFLAVNIPRRGRATLEAQAMTLLAGLEPHFTHAFRVGETLSELALQAAVGPRSGQAPSQGGLLVTDRNLVLIWAEPGAMPLHGRLFGLDHRGKLVFADVEAQAWAEALSARAPLGKPLPPGFALVSQGEAWSIQALPGLRGAVPSPLFPGAFLNAVWPEEQIAFVLKRQDAVETPQHRLTRQYRLSPAEAEVALLVAEGRATAEIARLRQVSIHTVRNQIRAVLDKMDARHRGDIIRLALSTGEDP